MTNLGTNKTASTKALGTLILAAAIAGSNPSAALANCLPGDTGPCDDGVACTTDDRCSDGACVGLAPALPATCDWAISTSSPSGSRTRAAHHSVVRGSICGERITIEGAVTGDVVTTVPSAASISVGDSATVDGIVVNPTRTAPIAPGTILGSCQDAHDSTAPSVAMLASPAFRSSGEPGPAVVAHHGNLTLTATGPLNVIEFDSLLVNESATITLDAAGIADAVFVLRVSGRLHLKANSSIVLTGGAEPERVILYGSGQCRFSRNVTGAGAVFCPNDAIRLDRGTRWTGALVGGDRIDLRTDVELTHVASAVPAY